MKKIKATTLLIAMMGGCIALFLTYHVGFFFGQIDGLLKIVAEKNVTKLELARQLVIIEIGIFLIFTGIMALRYAARTRQ